MIGWQISKRVRKVTVLKLMQWNAKIPHRTYGLILSLFIIWVLPLGCGHHGSSRQPSPVFWYEGFEEKIAWPAEDELAVLLPRSGSQCSADSSLAAIVDPGATIIEKRQKRLIVQLPATARLTGKRLDRHIKKIQAHPCDLTVGLVYYTDRQRAPERRLIHTNEVIVRFSPSTAPSRVEAIESRFGLNLKIKLRHAPHTRIYTIPKVREVIKTANKLQGSDGVVYAYPNWIRPQVTKKMKRRIRK